jgi:hypothetical protein
VKFSCDFLGVKRDIRVFQMPLSVGRDFAPQRFGNDELIARALEGRPKKCKR